MSEEMHDLDATALLAAGRLEVQRIVVPELGGAVYIRSLSGYEFEEYEKALARQQDDVINARARLLVMCLCDAKGALQFGPADIKKIGQLPAAVVLRLFMACRKLNKLDVDSIKELAKNCETGLGAGSGSSSPTVTAGLSMSSNGVSPPLNSPS